MKNDKSILLGMNYITARQRLDRDLLFKLAIEAGHTCFRCNQPLERENFSVDHKTSWMNAESPKEAFFDVGNIAFSHHACNSKFTSRVLRTNEDRAEARRQWYRDYRKRNYTSEKRRARYERTGN